MDRPRLSRIPAELRIQVRGVDHEAQLRHGDISHTGLFVESTADFGPLGTVCTLALSLPDGSRALSVLAQLVRRAHAQDLWKGQVVTGSAFRFMPETPDKQRAVEALVQYFLGQALGSAGVTSAPRSAVSRVTGVVVLDAAWGLPEGQDVRLLLESADGLRTVELLATVAASAPVVTDVGVSTRTTLRMKGPQHTETSVEVAGASMQEALGALVERVELGEDQGPQERLAGVLGVVSLPGLVSFLEIQRMSGVISILRGGERAFIHVREGRVVDAEMAGAQTQDARLLVVEVLRWTDGAFEFTRGESARPDRVARPTMELLLEAARLTDEAVTTPTDF